MQFRRLFWLALALCLAVSRTTWAAPPAAQDRERARALMDLGDARFEAKQYAAALEQYRAADAIMGVPTTGIEVGRTLERMGLLLEAREVLRRVSEFPQRVDEPRPFSSARQRADRLLGDIAPRIPRVTLEVSGLAEGTTAAVSWDNKPLDPAKLGGYIEADPGSHHVVAVAAGFPSVTRDIKLAEGQALQVVLTFTTQATPVAAPRTAPATPPTSRVPEAAPRKPVLLWVGVAVTAAGVVVGSATGVYSLSSTSKAKEFCQDQQCSPEAQSHIDSAKTFANVSNVAFAVGVAGAGLAVWQFVAHREDAPKKKDRAQAHFDASFGLGQVALAGTF